MKNTKKGDKVVVKAFAVINTLKSLQEGMPIAKLFNKSMFYMSEAIFNWEDDAIDYKNRLSKLMKLAVVPCEITYYKPSPKKLKK